MLACLILIVSSILAFVGFKKGFYVMFATLFNLMFAIFISVLTTRLVVSLSPGFEHSGYYAAASILLMFGLIFGLLQTVAWIFFFRYREDYFPALFDKVGSVILGFLCGYVVCLLLILALCVTPCSKRGKMNWLCDHEKMQRRGKTGVVTVCKFLAEYSLQCFIGDRAEQEIDFLLKLDRTVEEKKEDSSLLLPEDRLSEEIE